MEFDLRHSLVNSLANIMYYYYNINCTYILFKFTLFKTQFLCLISRLYLSHKICHTYFFYCKKQMIDRHWWWHHWEQSRVYMYTDWLCNNSLEFFISYIFIIFDSSNEKAVFLRCFKVWKLWLFYETMPLLKKMRNVSCSTARRLPWNH